MPELFSSDNVHLLSEDDMDDDPLDFESRDQQVPDLYEGSEDDFDESIEVVQELRSEEHHKDCFDYKSEPIQTCEASESNTNCIQKEVPSQNPVVHHLDLDQNTVDGYTSVFSLSTNGFDVSFMENVNHIAVENSTDSLLICREETVLQTCKIDPNLLDTTDKGIFLVGIIGGKTIPMMIDTGASCSVMSRNVFNSIPVQCRPKLINENCGIRSVSGDLTKCDGIVKFDMTFGDIKLPIKFHVADIADKVILGMSFLSEFGGTLDTKNGTMTINNEVVPCLVCDGKPKPRRVYVTGEYIIPPGTEVILPGTSRDKKGDIRSNSTVPMLFEPKPNFVKQHGLLICASTAMNHKSTIPIRVFNPTEDAITLKSGRDGIRCGYLTPTSVESEIFSKADMVAQVGIDLEKACDNEMPEHLRKLFHDSCVNLNEHETALVKEKLIKYQDVFSKGEDDIGRTTVAEHVIKTKTDTPLRQRPRPLPAKQNEEVERQIRLLLESGMISVSNSAWSSPIVCVRKKDGSLRMCCDYRKLNDITVKDAHPIPPINQSIDALAGSKYFCSLDLISGYYQVPMHPESKAKSAFCTRNGLYEWNVMSFGLCNAPGTFQRMMERILDGLHWSICMVYLDDILIYGNSVTEVLDRLEMVFIRLRGAGLKLKPKKCHLFTTEVLYLGYKISEKGVHTDPAKVKAVEEFPRPEDVNGVRKFLGLTNYYRKFIKDYAKIAFPLNRLLDKKGKKSDLFDWTDICEDAFQSLKEKLVSAPILALPRDTGEFVMDTDASAEGLGGVLHQEQDGELRVIAYSSKALSKEERNYCVSRQELLAIVYHISHWRCYIWGNHFTVRTDHASLKYLISFKDPTGQLARWICSLSEYDYEIVPRPGKKNGNADSMSRIPCGGKRCLCAYACSDPTLTDFDSNPCPLRVITEDSLSCEDVDIDSVLCSHMDEISECDEVNLSQDNTHEDTDFPFPWTSESLKKAQRQDSVLKEVINFVETGSKPSWGQVSHAGEDIKSFLANWKSLVIHEGLLFRRNSESKLQQASYQLVIPDVYRSKLLYHYHDSITGGHLGVAKVYSKLQSKYFWPNMKDSVYLYIKTCLTCQKKKSPPKSFCAPLKKYVVGVPFERVAADVMGPLVETQKHNRYVLVVTDYFTRWVEAYPIPDQTAETIAKVLASEWVTRFGCMSELHSDNGTNFVSEVMASLCKLLGVERSTTIVRRPQSDGVCERFNHTIQAMLSTALTDHVFDWDEVIPFLLMAYRASRHESTGFSPNKMLFGTEIRLPLDAYAPESPDNQEFNAPEYVDHVREMLRNSHDIARGHLEKAVEYQQRSYLNRLRPHAYQLKEPIWYWNPVFKKGQSPKLLSFWTGPFYIVEVISDVVYRIQKNARCTTRVVHHNQIKPCFFREEQENQWLDNSIEKFSKKEKKAILPDAVSSEEGPNLRRSSRVRTNPSRYGNVVSS